MDKKMRFLFVVGLAVVLTACTTTSPTRNVSVPETPVRSTGVDLTSDFSRSKLIAADFVATIAQIPATDPATTVLGADKPKSRFGELLLGALQKAGFDLRLGENSSNIWLAYNAIRDEQPSDEGNPVYTFIVAAGDVKLKRSYEVDEHGVRPTGGMFVRGASINNVVSDDSMFTIGNPKPENFQSPKPENFRKPERENVPPSPTIADLNSDGVKITPDPPPESYVKSKKVFTQEEMQQRRELEETVAALAPLRDLATLNEFKDSDAYAEVPNIYETKRSRYQDIFKDYHVVDTSVLIFPDDSLLLGRENKNVIRRYATAFNSDTDVMSVIGCSHGKSKIKNGNAYLANGRAYRVKEEFLAVGLEPKKVLEEGCWADVAYPDMPARGVLVQHKRLSR